MFENNLNQTQFAKSLGLDQTTISAWLKNKNKPQYSARDKILEIYNIDIFSQNQIPHIDLEHMWVEIKFHEDAKAFAAGEYEILKVDRKMLNARVDPTKHQALRVHGDAMEPTFKDGDVIFAEPFSGDFANNRAYIIKREHDVSIRRLRRESDLLEIISDNPDYENYKLESGKVEIIGRVV